MAETTVDKVSREKAMAVSRLNAVADLANSNVMVASALREAARHIDSETYMSNGMARAIARLSNL